MLNAEQQNFSDMILGGAWSRVLLTGEGGAGKTFALCSVISELARQGKKVLASAPTHLAKNGLAEKMDEDVRHLIEARTVASLLKQIGFKTDLGGTAFGNPDPSGIAEYDVVVIDEVSMVGKAAFSALMEGQAKIIFTGDFAQLPPVLQESPDWELEISSGAIHHVHFVQQMRAQGPIHQLAQMCREEAVFPTEDHITEQSSVIVHADRHELLDDMLEKLCADERGLAGMGDYRFLTHTNRDVLLTSSFIRDMAISFFLGEAESANPFCVGESLLAYATSAAAYNGEVVKIESVQPDIYHDAEQYPWASWMITITGSRGTDTVRTIPPREMPKRDQLVENYREMLKEAYKRKDSDAIEMYLERITHLSEHWVKFGYVNAMTTHKSQGQSIPFVYLDTLAIDKASGKKKLLYVGVSRASRELHTILVPPRVWKVVRGINDEFKAAKEQYEEVFGEPHWKFKLRMIEAGAIDGAQTPPQKAALTALYLDAIESRMEELDALMS
jgi:ATP-dependent exoDNAse (exonuclease V) alpha subunit